MTDEPQQELFQQELASIIQRLATLETDVRDLEINLDIVRRRLAEVIAVSPPSTRENCPSCGRILKGHSKCNLCGWKETAR